MTNPHTATPSLSEPSNGSNSEDQNTTLKNLRSSLEGAQAEVKKIRREKNYELKKLEETHQTQLSIALKDQQCRLHKEKVKDWELQKESLMKKHESELQKMGKVRDAEANKLRADVMRLQEEINKKKINLSGKARATFESEQARHSKEVLELREHKKQQESAINKTQEKLRKKSAQVLKMADHHQTEIERTKREWAAEVRKLIEELRSKEREISTVKKEVNLRDQQLQIIKEDNQKLIAERPQRSPAKSNSSKTLQIPSPAQPTAGSKTLQIPSPAPTAGSKTLQIPSPAPTAGSKSSSTSASSTTTPGGCILEDEHKQQTDEAVQKIINAVGPKDESPSCTGSGELNADVPSVSMTKQSTLQDQCQELATQNHLLVERIMSLEEEVQILQDDNALFYEQNEQLEVVHQGFEELIEELEAANASLEKELTQKDEAIALEEEDVCAKSSHQMAQEALAMKEKLTHLTSMVEALQNACMDKDKQIEHISHKLRRAKNRRKVVRFLLPSSPTQKVAPSIPGLRETYFGYETDDTSSVCSDTMSASSHISSFNGDSSGESSMENSLCEQLGTEDLMSNMKRLVREHLELERAFCLLQSQQSQQAAKVSQDQEDALKNKEERDLLHATICQINSKISDQESAIQKLQGKLHEAQEQCEELEFRNLEMEETNAKLVEEIQQSFTVSELPVLTSGGELQMLTREAGFHNLHLLALIDALHRVNKVKELGREDRVAILQARTVVHVADKSLSDLRDRVSELTNKVYQFEQEKTEWLEASDVANQLAVEHEATRQQLSQALQTVESLKSHINDFERSEAVHKYTAEYNDVTEQRYRDEISTLRRQIATSSDSHAYERELLQDQLHKLRLAEKGMTELKSANMELVKECEQLQEELSSTKEELNTARNELCNQQEALSLTESEKEGQMAASITESEIDAQFDLECETTDLYYDLHSELQDGWFQEERGPERSARLSPVAEDESSYESTPEKELDHECTHHRSQIQGLEGALLVMKSKLTEIIKQETETEEQIRTLKSLNMQLQQDLLCKNETIKELQEKISSNAYSLKTFTQELVPYVKKDSASRLQSEASLNGVQSQAHALVNQVLHVSKCRYIKELEVKLKAATFDANDYQIAIRLIKENFEELTDKLQKEVDHKNCELYKLQELLNSRQEQLRCYQSKLDSTCEITKAKDLVRGVINRGLCLYANEQIKQRTGVLEVVKAKTIGKCVLGSSLRKNCLTDHNSELNNNFESNQVDSAALMMADEEVSKADPVDDTPVVLYTDDDLTSLRAENDKLKEKQTELEAKLKAAEDESYKARMELEDALDKVDDMQEKLDAKKSNKKEGLSAEEAAKGEENQKDIRIRQLEGELKEIGKLQEELKSTQQALKEAESKAANKEQEANSTLAELNDAEAEITELKLKNSQADQKEAEINELKKDVDVLNKKLEAAKDKERAAADSQAAELSKDAYIKQLDCQLKEAQALKEEHEKCKDVEAELKSTIQEKEQECYQARLDLEDVQDKMDDLNKKNSDKKDEIQKLRDKLHTEDEQETELKKKDTYIKQLEAELKEVGRLDDEVMSSEARLTDANVRIAALEDELKILKGPQPADGDNGMTYPDQISELKQVAGLESQRRDMMNMQGSIAPESIAAASSQDMLHRAQSFDSSPLSPATLQRTFSPNSMADPRDHMSLSKPELLTRMHELDSANHSQQQKIEELTSNLEGLRHVVQSMTNDVDSDVNAGFHRPEKQDAAFETRVLDLVKSEVDLQVRVIDLERTSRNLRDQLGESKAKLRAMEALDRKGEDDNENMLQRLADRSETTSENDQLQKCIDDLLQKNVSLQEKVAMLEETELSLRRELNTNPAVQKNDREMLVQLLSELRHLKVADSFQSELQHTQPSCTDELVNKDLEIRLDLKKQSKLLEEQGASLSAPSLGAVADAPDIVLRHQVRQLEKKERHLRQQLLELLHEKEELQEGATRDKDHMHDLNVRLHEILASNGQLQEQMSLYEVQETQLRYRLEELSNRSEELEGLLTRSKLAEKQARSDLHRLQNNESGEIGRLQQMVDDLQASALKYKRHIADIEKEKRSLVDKLDEMSEHIGDLESSEMSLRQKLKNFESHESELQTRVADLEGAESSAKLHAMELETKYEEVSAKIIKLEHEKLNLDLEASSANAKLKDLEAEIEDMKNEIKELETCKETLGKSLSIAQEKESVFVAQNKELEAAKCTLESRMEEIHRQIADSDQRESEAENSFLRLQITQLKHDLDTLSQEKQILKAQLRVDDKGEELCFSCGHDAEISMLKSEMASLSTAKQAHELLKENYEDMKSRLTKLQLTKKLDYVEISSKQTQAGGDDHFFEHRGNQALKLAIGVLRTTHPDAYLDFTSKLQQQGVIGSDTAPEEELPSVAEMNADWQAWLSHKNRHTASEEEDPLWQKIEQKRGPNEETYWANIERNAGDLDEMSVSLSFDDDSDSGHVGFRGNSSDRLGFTPLRLKPNNNLSSPAAGDDSHYPAYEDGALSADEASEIAEDDQLYTPRALSMRARSCDRSISKDSAFSETTQMSQSYPGRSLSSPSYLPRPKPAPRSSIESIADSGMSTLHISELADVGQRGISREKRPRDTTESDKIRALEITALQKEVQQQHEEIERLNTEVSHYHENVYRNQDTDKQLNEAHNHITQMQQQLLVKEDTIKQLMERSEEVSAHSAREKEVMQEMMSRLQDQSEELQQLNDERQRLQEQVHAQTEQLQHQKTNEDGLLKTNVQLQHQVDEMTRQIDDFKNKQYEFDNMLIKFKELEQSSSVAEGLVTPLRAKVVHLTQLCQSKDDLLSKHVAAHRYHDDPAELVRETERILKAAVKEPPLSPLNTKKNPHETSLDALECSPPSISSPLQMSRTPVTMLDKKTPPIRRPKSAPLPSERVFVAVKDYEPRLLPHPTRKGEEIPLKEGQKVKVTGEMDEVGFLVVEADEHVGIAPKSHLLPAPMAPPQSLNRPVPPRRSKRKKRLSNGSPEQIRALATSVSSSSPPHFSSSPAPPLPSSRSATPNKLKANGSIAHPAFLRQLSAPIPSNGFHGDQGNRQLVAHRCSPVRDFNSLQQNEKRSVPEPPRHFNVHQVIGQHSLLLTWRLPSMDDLSQSNGTLVHGYKLLISGRSSQTILSPYMTKAVMEHLDLTQIHKFRIHTLGEGGLVSIAAEAKYVPSAKGTPQQMAPPEQNAASEKQEDRRVFMAIYEYKPELHSPNEKPRDELSFTAGDIITTYGALRPDGFYRAKAHGKRGLAPASFMEEVVLLNSHAK